MCIAAYVRGRTEACLPAGHNHQTQVLAAAAPQALPLPTDMEKYAMSTFKRLSAFILALAFVSALGCAGSATQESTGEYVSDSWITTKIKASLADDRTVKATEVN